MHRPIVHACLLGAIAIAGVAHAAAPAPKSFQINLSAEVPPDAGFEIKEVGGWKVTEPQTLTWDAKQKKLNPLTLQMNVKSGEGKVQVKFADGLPPPLRHETDKQAFLMMIVKAGDTAIAAHLPVVVATKEEAKNGKQVALEITVKARGGAAPLAGKYSGHLPLVFETVVE